MKELERLLAPLKRAVIRYNLINYCIAALAAGVFIDIIIAAVSKFVLILGLWKYLLCVPALLLLIAAAAALILRPDTKKLCLIADKLGLMERCITAYGLLKDCKNDEMDMLEITDTIDRLRQKNFETEYRPALWLPLLKACGIGLILLAAVYFIPSPKQAQLDEQADVHERAMTEYERV